MTGGRTDTPPLPNGWRGWAGTPGGRRCALVRQSLGLRSFVETRR
ncbi:MAG TPA: hypothetical protein VJO52_09660 [Gemmatimonadaceae bacterium]|nr:hypothetical protein [Gemmatimonadaceae bacterium]